MLESGGKQEAEKRPQYIAALAGKLQNNFHFGSKIA